jgi:DtxR family Mn-dependent transcriptional regulator
MLALAGRECKSIHVTRSDREDLRGTPGDHIGPVRDISARADETTGAPVSSAPSAGKFEGYRAPMAEMHDATEEYLETILELEEEGVIPIRARLVERLGVSAPAVSEQVNRLVDGGYTQLMDDRSLRLTDKGRTLATTIVRRHRLAERLLVDVIGLEWEKVHKEAALWEHAISADVEEKLVLLLGDPATCPHGNPIPGSRNRTDTSHHVAITDANPGRFVVARISEKLELDDAALRFLADADLVPGRPVELVTAATAGTTVRTHTGDHVVTPELAPMIWLVAS